jgi:hypothetical protein
VLDVQISCLFPGQWKEQFEWKEQYEWAEQYEWEEQYEWAEHLVPRATVPLLLSRVSFVVPFWWLSCFGLMLLFASSFLLMVAVVLLCPVQWLLPNHETVLETQQNVGVRTI